ncbi:DUF2059 domain-containing protein [Ancylomarina longa]|uniref:DUF2059 domain-containing protein n=1 Tax=Ancylomarina longa TaxID=2487017 RepID=A0A434ATS3_9BACT|nr:DUF2059 domain-containing protein [Ancylomarina longa]RUT77753.1 DUF2059 domain-containing protein [Ancylomarina longa]
MKFKSKNLGTLLLLVLISISSYAVQNDNGEEYAKDVLHLFEINGSQASYKQTVQAIILHFKSQDSNVPNEYWQKAEFEFLNTSIDQLVKMLIPIYQKNLSHDDILAMIKFYESDAGKRIANKIPTITTESMQAGMIWGESIGKKIKADIENKGYKIRLPFIPAE